MTRFRLRAAGVAVMAIVATTAAALLQAQSQKLLTIDDLYDPIKKVNFGPPGFPGAGYTWVNDKEYLRVKDSRTPQDTRTEIVLVDALTGTERPLFEQARLASALGAVPGVSADEATRLSRLRTYVMNPPRNALLVSAGNDLFFWTLGADRVVRLTWSALPQAAALPEPSALQRLHARGRLRGTIAVLGPAFVACVAYVDPGNFATNIAGGAKYGYLLLWVLLAANLMAMLIQNLSAKVGIATGRNLPELCREHFSRPVSWSLWVQAELIAMATDLAEFVGAAIALNLLFGIPLFPAGLITAVAAFAVLALQAKGYRRFEAAIAGLLGLIILGFLYDTLNIGFDAGDAARGFIPGFAGTDSVLLATGILGATVMPHVIYLHSALTQGRIRPRDDEERRRLIHLGRIDVTIAMGIAGVVNMAMLVIAASLFHSNGLSGVDSIEDAYKGFDTLVGGGAALAFALALLASGFASSSVGTYAGQVVMQGFIARTIPLAARRAVTMAPALLVLALGLDPSRSLVISQVVLSFGIPFALVPLVLLTRRRDIMGAFVNGRLTTALAAVVAALIIALNGFLLYQTLL